MKKSILLLAVMAAVLCLSSCKKEENGKVLFKATIENPAQQSKTQRWKTDKLVQSELLRHSHVCRHGSVLWQIRIC